MPIISAIVAMDENSVIGNHNQLPWHLPKDLQHFKLLTNGHPILMGRKTFASIGKPLPNRTNIILTRDAALTIAGCICVTSIEDALKIAAVENQNEIFIIGGAEIFKQTLSKIQRIYLTIIHAKFSGDTYFPMLNPADWEEVSRQKHAADMENAYDYSFVTLKKR